MEKRKLKAGEYQILQRELSYLEKRGVLASGKGEEIAELYEIEHLSFTKTLLYVGSVLIGAGILSFVASNWAEIGKLAKFLLILSLFASSCFAGYKLESHLPKTARSFYYLGVLVFGAGIFLIGQMFHFGGDFQEAFMWWSLGIMPLAWVLRDKWILLASSLLILFYMTHDPLMGQSVPIWILLWSAAIYFLNEKIGFMPATAFVNGLLQLAFIASVLSYFLDGINDTVYIYGLVYLVIGIGLVLARKSLRDVYVILGYLVHGVAALFLSFGENWPAGAGNFFIPFSILYILFLLFLIKKGSLLSIVILCALIFRFYLDITFAFLPKSLVFVIGGLLLLGFGLYFERQRKKGAESHV
ncbi:hypothetical protein WQ57_17630 [Mesobacillus campisalis]|uniref:DUF2157 domain-containing protein n=1 Tax=Mesobacillus campisalis TaxID=1408103 RepID=A0A0M2SSW3_9BACI|nr:DUF2157 domain-containing protein [Mesobacillus campisalis]KKK36781.1 hypothetical protein WQ57_17630 [Mesobacillus campisalis]